GPRGIVALRGGMGALTGAMAASLADRLRLSTPVTAIEPGIVRTAKDTLRADAVVLAVPPPVAARLLAPLSAEAAALATIPMAPLAVVHMGGPGPGPTGFGALVPRGEGIRTLG